LVRVQSRLPIPHSMHEKNPLDERVFLFRRDRRMHEACMRDAVDQSALIFALRMT
jgi:hypothetical protein